MSTPAVPDPFSGAPAAALVDELLQDPVTGGASGTTASEVLTAALRSVNETGDVVQEAEGWQAIAAVALLLTESTPGLLDAAPHREDLLQYLQRWDTELTPARRTLCGAVLRRLELDVQNAWLTAVDGQFGSGSVHTMVEGLSSILADA